MKKTMLLFTLLVFFVSCSNQSAASKDLFDLSAVAIQENSLAKDNPVIARDEPAAKKKIEDADPIVEDEVADKPMDQVFRSGSEKI